MRGILGVTLLAWSSAVAVAEPAAGATGECALRRLGTRSYRRCIGRVEGYPREVAFVIPEDARGDYSDGLAIYLHGHNVSTPPLTLAQYLESPLYRIEESFIASGRKAVLVVPHSTGRCDQFRSHIAAPGRFEPFVASAWTAIAGGGAIGRGDPISIAGHSGAYLPIAAILSEASGARSRIREVLLLDSLYGEEARFDQWLRGAPDARFWSVSVPGTRPDAGNTELARLLSIAPSVEFIEVRSGDLRPEDSRRRVGFATSRGDHWTTVGLYLARLWSGGTTPGAVAPECPAGMVRLSSFCVDRFEAPNRAGERPFVGRTAFEGEEWCRGQGKRLCSEDEWERSCRGGAGADYPYGDGYVRGACNDDKEWRVPDWGLIATYPSPEGRAEIERLDQSEPSGSRARCGSQEGVHDLTGNAAEWVSRSFPHPNGHDHVMKGCYWAGCFGGTPPGCGFTNPAHPGRFRSYESGFRCCLTLF